MNGEAREVQRTAIRAFCMVHGFDSVSRAGVAMGLEEGEWAMISTGQRLMQPYHIARIHAVLATPTDGEDPHEWTSRSLNALVNLTVAVGLAQWLHGRATPSRRHTWGARPPPAQRSDRD